MTSSTEKVVSSILTSSSSESPVIQRVAVLLLFLHRWRKNALGVYLVFNAKNPQGVVPLRILLLQG